MSLLVRIDATQDGSGKIDSNELATVMRSLGYSPTEKQLKAMIERNDANNDGEIDFAEFCEMMAKAELKTDFQKEIEQAFAVSTCILACMQSACVCMCSMLLLTLKSAAFALNHLTASTVLRQGQEWHNRPQRACSHHARPGR